MGVLGARGGCRFEVLPSVEASTTWSWSRNDADDPIDELALRGAGSRRLHPPRRGGYNLSSASTTHPRCRGDDRLDDARFGPVPPGFADPGHRRAHRAGTSIGDLGDAVLAAEAALFYESAGSSSSTTPDAADVPLGHRLLPTRRSLKRAKAGRGRSPTPPPPRRGGRGADVDGIRSTACAYAALSPRSSSAVRARP